MSGPIVHGKHSGLNWHRRKGVPVCEECREFHRVYMAERRQARATRRAFTFPTEVVVPDFDGLGSTIARSLRESA